jgi:L-lactate permease
MYETAAKARKMIDVHNVLVRCVHFHVQRMPMLVHNELVHVLVYLFVFIVYLAMLIVYLFMCIE